MRCIQQKLNEIENLHFVTKFNGTASVLRFYVNFSTIKIILGVILVKYSENSRNKVNKNALYIQVRVTMEAGGAKTVPKGTEQEAEPCWHLVEEHGTTAVRFCLGGLLWRTF